MPLEEGILIRPILFSFPSQFLMISLGLSHNPKREIPLAFAAPPYPLLHFISSISDRVQGDSWHHEWQNTTGRRKEHIDLRVQCWSRYQALSQSFVVHSNLQLVSKTYLMVRLEFAPLDILLLAININLGQISTKKRKQDPIIIHFLLLNI